MRRRVDLLAVLALVHLLVVLALVGGGILAVLALVGGSILAVTLAVFAAGR